MCSVPCPLSILEAKIGPLSQPSDMHPQLWGISLLMISSTTQIYQFHECAVRGNNLLPTPPVLQYPIAESILMPPIGRAIDRYSSCLSHRAAQVF
jgi:hypothetical protein